VDHPEHDHDSRHDAAIHSFCLTRETPVPWPAFAAWLHSGGAVQGVPQ